MGMVYNRYRGRVLYLSLSQEGMTISVFTIYQMARLIDAHSLHDIVYLKMPILPIHVENLNFEKSMK
jgi:hypothetical protein